MEAYSTAAIPTDNPEARGNPITEDAGISGITMVPNTSSTQVASEDATTPNISSTQVASEDAPAPNTSSTQVVSEDAPAPNTSSTQVASEDAPGIQVTNSEPRNNRIAEEEEIREMRKAFENHMIVAAQIATVTFVAGFTPPGGYVQSGSSSNKGNEGMAVLSLPDNSTAIKHRPFFKYFVVADGTAMVLSMCAVGIYFLAALPIERKDALMGSLIHGYCLTMFAMVAMVIAFVTGLLAVLPRSSMAGNAIKFIVLPAFLFLFFLPGWFIMKERTRDRGGGGGRGGGGDGDGDGAGDCTA